MPFFGKGNKTEDKRKDEKSQTQLTDAQKLLEEFKKASSWKDSAAFKAVYAGLEKMAATEDLEQKEVYNQQFAAACKDYLEKRQGASTESGKERLKLVEKAMGFSRFTGCQIAYSQIKAMDNVEVDMGSAMKITGYSRKFQDAYEAFRATPDKTAVGIDQRNLIQKQMEEHLEVNLDAVRSKPKLEQAIHDGKKWGNVSFPVPLVKADVKTGTVANGQSTRSVVEVNGKKGIFSEYMETDIQTLGQNFVSALPPGPIQLALGNHPDVIEAFGEEVRGVTFSSKEMAETRMTALMYRVVNERLKDPGASKGHYDDLIEAMEDPDMKGVISGLGERIRAVGGMHSAAKEAGVDCKNGKLDRRNELTSRMAEALGLGHMVAHSERIKMMRNGKIVEGNFMEFVEGLDVKTENETERNQLDKAGLDDPRFVRDANRLELFDYLCGQSDRHDGNALYQIGEPDKDGKRQLTGLKAIDNDMAFLGVKSVEQKGKNGMTRQPKWIAGVDRELAERISRLDRDELEFYLGDVLDKKHMDLTMERLEQMKEDFKNVPLIEKEEWEKGSPTVEAYKKQNGGFYREAKDLIHMRNKLTDTNQLQTRRDQLAKEQAQFQKNVRELEEKRGLKQNARKSLPVDKAEKERIKQTVKDLEEKERQAAQNRRNAFHQERRQRVLTPKVAIGKRPGKEAEAGREGAGKKQQGMAK